MSRKDKLLARFLSIPTDFTWEEMMALLGQLGYRAEQGDGSRVKMIDVEGNKILLHRPHPGNIIKKYIMREVKATLREHGKYG